jgi:polysaccharide export outer membrane protein
MPTYSFLRSHVGRVVAGLLLACVSSFAQQQGYSAPKVGGTSSYDNSTPLSGSNGTAPKRPVGSVSATPEDFSKLTLSPGFLLSMEVYDVPEFSTDLRVDADGNVAVPMIGSVHVAGKTLTESASLISTRLQSSKILNNPQVNLNITQYAGSSVSVLGEVHNPGRVELLAPHTLEDVLALAGGETQYAGNVVEIRHAVGRSPERESIHYSQANKNAVLNNSLILPGDVVTVLRAGIVYVLGSVNRPGGYVMQEDGELNLLQAIALAYGTSMQAAVGSIRVVRKLPDGHIQEVPVHYRDVVKGKLPPPTLQAEDVVYVPVSKVKTVVSAGLVASTASAMVYRY